MVEMIGIEPTTYALRIKKSQYFRLFPTFSVYFKIG